MTADGATVRLARAYAMAARAHVGQYRKGRGRVPYINHPCEVAELVAEAGGDVDLVIAAVLHDVVEDSAFTVSDVEQGFGSAIARLVDELSDAPEWTKLDRPERKALQAEEFRSASDGARRIKIADQTSNLRDISREPDAWSPNDAARYIEGAERVVTSCRGADPVLEAAFDAAVGEAMAKIGGAQ